MRTKGLVIKFLVCVAIASTLHTPRGARADEGDNAVLEDINRQVREGLRNVYTGPPQFALTGKLEAVGDKQYSINGETFTVKKKTLIVGNLQAGQVAEARGTISKKGVKVAKSIVIKGHELETAEGTRPRNDRPGEPRKTRAGH